MNVPHLCLINHHLHSNKVLSTYSLKFFPVFKRLGSLGMPDQKLKILIVDDNHDNYDLLEDIF